MAGCCGCIRSNPIPTVIGDQVIGPHDGILGIRGNMDAVLNVSETICSPGIGAYIITFDRIGGYVIDPQLAGDHDTVVISGDNVSSSGQVSADQVVLGAGTKIDALVAVAQGKPTRGVSADIIARNRIVGDIGRGPRNRDAG